MSSLPRLIGVTGQARHGKDTVSQLLVEGGFHRIALADNVKELAIRIDPILSSVERERYKDNIQSGREDVARWTDYKRLSKLVEDIGWESAKQEPEVRRILQAIGNEVRELIDSDAWINALIRNTSLEDGYYVISDIRYANEAQWVSQMGGEVWKVERPNFDNGLGDLALHGSEAQIAGIFADLTIRNDGTLEELESKVRRYVQQRRYA